MGETSGEGREAGAEAPFGPTVRTGPLIVDTDIGGDPDDAIALVAAARTTPALALVTTTDEQDGQRARFARHLLDLLGRPNVPVVPGPDARSSYFCVDGLVPRSVPTPPGRVVDAVSGLCRATDGPVRWLGIGPMTNLAAVLTAHPDLANQLHITQMGGALNYRHPDRAEHNISLDPDAAHAVLARARRFRLVVSDVTFRSEIEIAPGTPIDRGLAAQAARDEVATDHTATGWAALLYEHMDRWYENFYPATMQHDGLTLTAALGLPYVEFAPDSVSLDAAGRMTRHPGGIPVHLSVAADYPAFLTWLTQALQLDQE